MKTLSFLLCFFAFVRVQAQDYTKMYITTTGDTIRPHTKIKISDTGPFNYIYPYYNLDPMRLNAAKRYVMVTMPGKEYSFDRLSRLKVDKNNYREIGVIRILDPKIHRLVAVDFFVEIESALKNKEITLVN